MAYTEGGVGPIDRLRAVVRDTAATAIFSDAEYYPWIPLSAEHLCIYYPATTAGVTTATAHVILVSTASLKLELRVNGVLTSITLAPSDENTVGDLVDRVGVEAPGWIVGFSTGSQHAAQWSDTTSLPWRVASFRPTIRQMIDHARPGDLALTRQGAVNALGDEDNYARLRFYLLASGLVTALRAVQGRAGADADYSSRKKGNSSWTRGAGGIDARIDRASAEASYGIYQGLV